MQAPPRNLGRSSADGPPVADASHAEPAERPLETLPSDGTIPFRLRIGVTGHRSAQATPELDRAVDEAVAALVARVARDVRVPVRCRAVSPLAEGADQIVARRVLHRRHADLEVPLPLPLEPYKETFDSADGRDELDRLYVDARVKHVLTRDVPAERAFQVVGQWVVDNSDCLIAIWDNRPARGPGGTAQVVGLARTRVPCLPIAVIDPVGCVTEEPEPESFGAIAETYAEFAAFNTARIREGRRAPAYEGARQELFGARGGSEREVAVKVALERWMLPRYVRADLLAQRFQREHDVTANATLVLAAAAVALGALVAVLWPHRMLLKWTEVAAIAAILAMYGASRWRQPHRRWLAYRSLAERLRVAPFLAVVDDGARGESRRLDKAVLRRLARDELVSWHERAFAEVWEQRPTAAIADDDLDWVKAYLVTSWIDPQIAYHERSTQRNRDGFKQLRGASLIIFAITIVATMVHSLTSYDHVAAVLAIALPAAGGALSGIANNREHQRQSKRYRGMAAKLRATRTAVEGAGSLQEVRHAVFEAFRQAADENDEWVELMSVHEAQLS